MPAADRQEPPEALAAKTTRLKEKLAKLTEEMRRLDPFEIVPVVPSKETQAVLAPYLDPSGGSS